MKFSKTTLKNGLRIICVPMPSMESAAVEVLVGAGTRHEKRRVNGLAHFLEHMVFKGTKKYPSAQAVSVAVDEIGAEINADTGKERTAYYIKAWERHLDLAFRILSDFVKAPLLRPADIEKEKGVILEEIALSQDIPMKHIEDVWEKLLYGNFSLGWDVLGTRESIPRVKREDFEEYRARLYRPENMVLAVAGKFAQANVLKLAEEYFGELKWEVGGGKLDGEVGSGRAKQRTNPSGKPQIKLLEKKTEQAHIQIGVRGNPRGHPDRYKEVVLTAILGGGMSSRLFSEIREKRGLAYYVLTAVDHYRDNGYLSTRAGVRVSKIEEAIKVILAEYRKMGKKGGAGRITGKELKKAKEYLKGKLALGLEDTHQVADFFGDQELAEKKVRSIDEIIGGVDGVELGEVQELAERFFQENRLNLALIGPYEDEEKFRKLLKF